MSKKRIHELAKEYGMSGKELAAKLRDLGFTQIRSHMTALDEFEELQVQGVLEAHGLSRGAGEDGSMESSLGSGVIRRKKKKKGAAGDEGGSEDTPAATQVIPSGDESETAEPVVADKADAAASEAPKSPEVTETAPKSPEAAPQAVETPAAESVAPPVQEVAAEETAPALPSVQSDGQTEPKQAADPEPQPEVEVVAKEVPKAEPTVEVKPTPSPAASSDSVQHEDTQKTPTRAVEEPAPQAPEAVQASKVDEGAAQETQAPVEPTVDAPQVEAPEVTEEPAAAKAQADETASPAEASAKLETEGKKKKKKPDAGKKGASEKSTGPAGKVVGFIDLSKMQSAPKKSESRRLRSRDDVLPDVRPTLRHDSRNNMLRGDRGARNSLTAAQLREREAGRYKRHQRPGGAAGGGRGRGGDRGAPRGPRLPSDASPYSGQTIKVELPVTVKRLAEAMAIKGNQLMKTAIKELGFGTVMLPSTIDEDTATLLAHEYDIELEFVREVAAEEALIEDLKAKRDAIEDEHIERRNPTVAFLGHVDHGKTTLVDKIRSSTVADGEHGGITQHIGAYRVTTDLGHHVTIIDTPGHAAFTGMRARGARAVDVVVLVVAADAGVQPQTEEALAHARAADVPIIVALNKIDRAEANPQRAMEQLSGIDVIPEEWGGQVAIMPVSGITGEGLQELLERIFLESEILDEKLACHPDGPASGTVLEAEVQQGKGIVAHLLVQDGTLERGNVILAGEGYGRVRSMHDDFGREIESAGPSVPVEVSGLSAIPGVGEPFHVVQKLDEAKKVAEERARKNRGASMAERRKLDNANLLQQVTGPGTEEVNIIIRADVQGTVEVLKNSIQEPIHTEVEARVLQAGVGAVTENDIMLASTSNAMVVAFNVATGSKARQAAEREGVEIRNFNVLYDVIDTVRGMMEGRLAPDVSEEVTGHVEIRRLFRSSKIGNIAGSHVLDGTISRDSRIRLMRDDAVIYTGTLASLKRESDDAKEVREGFDCGIVIRNYNDIREGDIVEAYKIVETKRTLESPQRTTTS